MSRRDEEGQVLLGDSVKDAHTWNQLGLALAKGNHFEAAFEAMSTGLALDPSVVALSVNLATVLGNLGRHKDAVRILERSIANTKAAGKPASMSILNNLGVAELDLGRPEAALRHFMRAEAGLRGEGMGAGDPMLMTVINNVQRARGLTTSGVGA
jgi:tetratricopeptide (TPR) repeat protein